jgi:hypothetical protein
MSVVAQVAVLKEKCAALMVVVIVARKVQTPYH